VLADEMLVMYAGQIVERGPTEQLLAEPLHPYTRLLLSAAPDPRAPHAVGQFHPRRSLRGAVDPAAGCRFTERCPLAIDRCSHETPALVEARPGQSARCHVTASTPERNRTP
jgi:oligopeptide/dipeptide ABC transporter ATP-binding protein